MNRKRPLVVPVIAAAMVALLGPPSAATAETPTPTPSSGGTVIPRTQTFPSGATSMGSYGGEQYVLWAEAGSPQAVLIRRRDAAVVRTIPSSGVGLLQMAQSALVTGESASSVTYADPVTGAALATRTFAEGEARLVGDLAWDLLRIGDTVVLRRAGKPDTTVLPSGATNVIGRTFVQPVDARTVLVQAAGGSRWVDVVDGTTRPLGGIGTPADGVTFTYPTATRVFAVDDRRDGGATVVWRDRATDALGHVAVVSPLVASTSTWSVLGDQLVVGTPEGPRPIDLTTGVLGDPIVSAPYRRPNLLRQGLTGWYVIVSADGTLAVREDDGSERVLWRRPERIVPAYRVAASDSWVAVAPWSDSSAYTDLPGGTSWRLGSDADPIPGKIVDMAGDTVLTRLGEQVSTRMRATWQGGSRDFTSAGGYLQPGGRVMLSIETSRYQDVRTGRVLTLPATNGVFDGGDYWWVPQGARPGDVAVRNLLDEAAPTRIVHTDVRCATSVGNARGRWVVLSCPGTAPAETAWIVDTLGVARPRSEPSTYGYPVPLGDGFAVVERPGPGELTLRWAALDLATGTETPLGLCGVCTLPRRDHLAGGLAVTANGIVSLDSTHQVRWVPRSAVVATELGEGTPDVTPPTVSITSPSVAVLKAGAVGVAWDWADPAGAAGERRSQVATFDAEYRVGTGAWVAPSWWQGMATPSLTWGLGATPQACVRVRARDVAGNAGAWVQRCWASDGTGPSVTSTSFGPRVVQAVVTSRVPYAWTAKDDLSGIVGYDVEYRSAGSNDQLRDWWPLNQPSAASTSTVVPVGSETCVRVRGRDRFGWPGPWSAGSCATVPVDDRRLSVAAWNASRASDSRALGGTVSVLSRKAAALQTPGIVTGRAVGLVVLRGPGQGAVDVYAGSTKLGRVSLAASSWRRDTVIVTGAAFSGQFVQVKLVTDAPARIDALAVLHG